MNKKNRKMFFKVTWLTVMVLLILPEKDIAKAQNTDLANEESRVSFQIKSHLFCRMLWKA